MIKRVLLEGLRILFLLGVLGAVAFQCYRFIYVSNVGLFDDDYLLAVASTDVLGKRGDGSCARTSYDNKVEFLHLSDQREAAVFRFVPILSQVNACPPVTVILSRRTAEAWVTVGK